MPSVEYEVEVDVEVWCNQCGTGLCGESSAVSGRGVHVNPCPDCMAAAKEEAENDGWAKGHEEGLATGKDAGWAEGYAEAQKDLA